VTTVGITVSPLIMDLSLRIPEYYSNSIKIAKKKKLLFGAFCPAKP